MTSFICEHTAEFTLVPNLKTLLEGHFKAVVPIFPWLSREFGRNSVKLNGNLDFYVLAMFARRPKLSPDGEIFFTINPELERVKQLGEIFGISVIAGCPKATNLWEFASSKECVWIDINHEYEYLTRLESLRQDQRLTEEQIVNLCRLGKKFSMSSLEAFVREVRNELPFSFFGVKYKPVYFLLLE